MKRLAILAAVTVAALSVASCTSSRATHSSSDPLAGQKPVTEIDVTAHEFHFDAPGWTIRAGQPVRVVFHNRGTLTHEWTIIRLGHDLSTGHDFADDRVLTEIDGIDWGHDGSATITIKRPGRYQVLCGLQGHFDAGMRATLNVISAA